MKKHLLSSILLSIILFNACNSNSQKEIVLLEYSKGFASNVFIGIPGYIIATEKHLVGFNTGADLFFYKQNTSQADSVYRFGKGGQGPDEFVHPSTLQYINDSLAGTYDITLRTFNEISLTPNTVPLKQKTLRFDNNMNFSILKTSYNQYIGMGAYPEGMFIMFDSLGNTIKNFFEYPFQTADERKIKNQLRAMAYQGKISANRSGTKFVYAAFNADIIHFYDILNGEIELKYKIEKHFCEYLPEEINGSFSAIIKSTVKRTYCDVYATDKYVYLLYSGKSYEEYKEHILDCDILIIYDWSGNLKKEISLNTPCKYLCVSPDDTKMWAISEIPEPTIIEFDLTKLNTDK
ncbi:MAG: TolB-like 6-bladed beta-propeller domain-containing protein [Tannerellaceae bacterium]|nr:TolB-like 6-bladed beta-propeller domain-containing protein [Tannerellaceae bacterium]